MTRDARLSALHRGDFSPGAALLSPAFAPDRLQRAPRSQVVVPGGRLPGPPGASGYKPPPQDATPRSAFRRVAPLIRLGLFAIFGNQPPEQPRGRGSGLVGTLDPLQAYRTRWGSMYREREANHAQFSIGNIVANA